MLLLDSLKYFFKDDRFVTTQYEVMPDLLDDYLVIFQHFTTSSTHQLILESHHRIYHFIETINSISEDDSNHITLYSNLDNAIFHFYETLSIVLWYPKVVNKINILILQHICIK